MLEIRELSVCFDSFFALRDVSLDVRQGEIVVLLGANGAGKSTLFRTISGLNVPVSGTIYLRGQGAELATEQDVTSWPAHWRVDAGISQAPEGKHLFPEMSVAKNLRLGAFLRRNDRDGVRQTMEEVFELFPILSDKAKKSAGTLSGGQQQMLAIGRALMARPRLLLLDEPSLGLAPRVVEEVLDSIVEINRRGTSVLLAEQNANAALRIAHRGYVIEEGTVALEGERDDLMGNDDVRRAYIGV